MIKNNIIFSRVFFTLLIFIQIASASEFIIQNDNLLDKRVIKKINEIGNEVKTKLNTNIFVYVKDNYTYKNIKTMEEKQGIITQVEYNITKNLKGSYVVITLALNLIHTNILMSNNLKTIIDKDDILDSYIIPILASKDKNKLDAKVSASILNGYAQVADVIAEYNNIKLKSSIGSSSKVVGTIWRVFIYTLMVIGLGIYMYIVFRDRRK